MPPPLAEQFAALWQSNGSPPDVFAFLARHSRAEPAEKLAVLLVDQQNRWKTSEPLQVESYLGRMPELASDQEFKLQLAVGEFLARQNGDSSPPLGEFLTRFADLGDTLRDKLSALESDITGPAVPSGATVTQTIATTVVHQRIGRYRLIRTLGEGTFGRVYLGFDDELQRQVAIKVPKPERFQKPEDAEAYLAEARTVARLDHPHIVPVHDMGRTDEGSIYVVSKFIEGRTLGTRLKEDRPPPKESARLLATIAQALHHAHQKRLIHRDVKPGNILLEDATGRAYLADFGLAIREEDYLRENCIAGTPAYMSPEQARGEGHRLDGRSDIFSLGVVLYELLTGKKPFRGSTANELLHQVVSVEPLSPRELDEAIPVELERICLKALSKRASDRYATAAELAEDLLQWEQGKQQLPTERPIVPKGLRSFDAGDADFFLDLLPGARDREGLPESIRFWKTRLEENDAEKTFSVGLIYGPSGCGKSSLVKAGLLPRLSAEVGAIYVEATPDDTETRILRGLRKQLPDLPEDLGLVETFTLLRRGEGRKVVIVLDQFEQWLHAHRAERDTALVSALRQCDGGKLQAVVMVRDDFAMAASRFMGSLDIPIVQGHNFATVDLFDVDHAQKVLTKFGQAFGKLPAQPSQLSDQEREFVGTVAAGLATDGKVVSVRLALFAEMVKGKPWVPATLEQVGGAEGIGVNFLEETFAARSANPTHRLHQAAAREVLKALLPEVGSDIKGHMRSHAELESAAGYTQRPGDYNELLRILDGELRLITPTDPEGFQTTSGSDPSSKYYQLTHDYLVPSLRDWLTRKQRETRRGRAELTLAERSATWNAKPERRYLPSLLEYLNISALAPRKNWTPPQRKLMRAAGWLHGVRSGVVAALLLVCAMAGVGIRNSIFERQQADRAASLVDTLRIAEIGPVPLVIKDLDKYRPWADPLLRSELAESKAGSREKLHLALALLPVDETQAAYLQDQLPVVSPSQFPVVRDALLPQREQLIEPLWNVALDEKRAVQPRFQSACALATYAPQDQRWGKVDKLVAGHLVTRQASDLVAWREALRPAKKQLLAALGVIYRDLAQERQYRVFATETLADFAADQPAVLVDLLADAEPFQYPVIFEKLERGVAIPLLAAEPGNRPTTDASEDEKEHLAKRQANAAVALVKLGAAEQAWPLLAHTPDPRARTYFIHWLSPLGGTTTALIQRLDVEPDVSIRRALLLMLGEFDESQLPVAARQPLLEKLLAIYETEPDAGLHAAAEWLLRRWGEGQKLQAIVEKLRVDQNQRSGPKSGEKRNWYVNSQGQTLVILEPGEFTMGSPVGEPDRREDEIPHRRQISRRFAILAHEVTKAQFAAFQAARPEIAKVKTDEWVKTDDSPQTAMTWYEAAAYCNWLSEQEGLAEDQWCYEPNAQKQYAAGMKARPKAGELSGYRLPSEGEWEYACRAGSVTSRHYGLSVPLLDEYAWTDNGKNRTWPVGSLKPNDWGLFDMLGNAHEWMHQPLSNYPSVAEGAPTADLLDESPVLDNTGRVLRGGSFNGIARNARSAFRYYNQPANRDSDNGFRAARTYP